MIDRLDRDAIDDQRRKVAKKEKLLDAQVRADIQQIMNLPACRRILYLFLTQNGIDNSPFSTNAMAQSHAIGKQDAGKWWINIIREHCPEKERQLRQEGEEFFNPADNEDED